MLSSAQPCRSTCPRLPKTNFGGGEDRLVGANRPARIVHIQQRIDGHQVHIGFEVGIERADIAPVGILFSVLVTKGKGEDAMRIDDRRNDIPAEIMRTVRIGRIPAELFEQESGREDVDAHGCQAMLVVAGNRLRLVRLLLETRRSDPARQPA